MKEKINDGEQLKISDELLKVNSFSKEKEGRETVKSIENTGNKKKKKKEEETIMIKQALFESYKTKSTEELEDLLEKLTKEHDEDEEIFYTTDNSDKRLDAHRDVIDAERNISLIKRVLEERQDNKTR